MTIQPVCFSKGLHIGHPAEQVVRGHLESVRQPAEVVEGGLPAAGLEMGNRRGLKTGALGELSLTQTTLFTGAAEALSGGRTCGSNIIDPPFGRSRPARGELGGPSTTRGGAENGTPVQTYQATCKTDPYVQLDIRVSFECRLTQTCSADDHAHNGTQASDRSRDRQGACPAHRDHPPSAHPVTGQPRPAPRSTGSRPRFRQSGRRPPT